VVTNLADLLITDLNGQSEWLTDFKNLKRKKRVNGEHSLSFLLILTERNEHSFNMAQEESVIELNGQEEYRIKKAKRRVIGETIVKQVEAHHVLFDLIDNRIYVTSTGTKTIQQAIDFALAASGYTYSVIDAFSTADLGEFGDDNSLSLLNKICDTYGAEIEENNRHLNFKAQIGVDAGAQIRRGYNLKTIEENIDSSNLSTYIKGYGKENEDGTYVVEGDYTSPNASIFGIRHADPIRDSRYTTIEGLTERLQKEIRDTPDISITVTFADMKKAGYSYDTIGKGDVVYVIDEILGIDYPARVLEIEDYPEENDPSGMTITITNYKKDITDYHADFEQVRKQVRGILNGDGKVRYNVLDEAVKIATEALTNAATELQFPTSGGIHAVDPTDPNKLTVYRSTGIGISRDGGQTFTEAITADGFVLSVGAIGELSANNIDVSGVILAINNEGFTTIDGDKITTGTITSDKINVTTLSAITADLGYVIAGTIDINTDLRVGNNIYLNDGTLGLKSLIFNNTARINSSSSNELDLNCAYLESNAYSFDMTSGSIRVWGTNHLDFYSYGGGWYMQDSTWIRAVGNKGIYTPGEIKGGTITQESKREYKENIALFTEYALDTIETTPVYRYNHKSSHDPMNWTRRRTGFIFEEVHDFLKNSDGVDLYAITGFLWKGVQELYKKEKELEGRIYQLEGGVT
jgi:phage minor structural protein